MQYTEGQIGRIFMVRIDDSEDMLQSLHRFVAEKNIHAGSIHFLGALMNGRLVTGPEEPVIPPVPHFVMFEGGWEVFGLGTIYTNESGQPHIHYHASVGRSGHALTGCLREEARTYLIVEAVILEFTGLVARREFDEKIQLPLPVLGREPVKKVQVEAKKEEEKPSAPVASPAPAAPEKKEESPELPGGLAEIIRDLTRRPPS